MSRARAIPTLNSVPPEDVNSLRSLLKVAGETSGTDAVPGNATTPTAATGDRTPVSELITLCVDAFSQLRMVPQDRPDADEVLPEVSSTKARSVSLTAAPWPRSTVPLTGIPAPATNDAPSAGPVNVVVTAVPPPTVPESAKPTGVEVRTIIGGQDDHRRCTEHGKASSHRANPLVASKTSSTAPGAAS